MIYAALFLRRAFLLDTIASGMMAVPLTFGAGALAELQYIGLRRNSDALAA